MKIIKTMFFFTILLLLIAPMSYAYPVTAGDLIKVANGVYGTTNGGEFKILNAATGEHLFTSFCLEINETINYTSTFKVQDISPYAAKGGVDKSDPWYANDNKDYISNSTKWLYWHYVTGDLDDGLIAGFSYSDAGANAVQKAIWQLEDETAVKLSGLDKTVYNAAKNYLSNSTNSFGDVAVMNIIYSNGTYAQSQLIANAPVPEPATMLLLGTGLLGLVGAGRKRFNKKG